MRSRLIAPCVLGFLSSLLIVSISVAQAVVEWSSPFGGTAVETAFDVALRSDGTVVWVGATSSANFPSLPGVTPPGAPGNDDAFVICFDPSLAGPGQLLWTAFLGGSERDIAYEVVVDGQDNVWVAGYTESVNFSSTPGAYQSTLQGGGDAFVARIDVNGAVVASTLVGGDGRDGAVGLRVTAGEVWIAGYTESSDYPVTPSAVQGSGAGARDAFVTRFDETLSTLEWSTYFGGSADEGLVPTSLGGQSFEFDRLAIDVDSDGRVLLCGSTLSTDFPVTGNAFETSPLGTRDGFVVVIDPVPTPSVVEWSSYFGGSNDDQPFEARWLEDGTVAMAGTSVSTDLPTDPAAAQPSFAGGGFDGFVARFDPSIAGAAGLLTLTYLGGPTDDSIVGMTVTGPTEVAVVGNSRGTFPTSADAWIPTYPGTTAFVGRVSIVDLSGPADLGFSSFWSESGGSVFWGVDARNNVLAVSGWTGDDDYPTVNPFDTGGVTLIGSVGLTARLAAAGPQFRRGDVNADGSLDISDAISVLSALFSGGPTICADASDANDDGTNDIADAILLLSTLFVPGTPPIAEPSPGCGEDPTSDTLDCAGDAGC